MSTSVQVLNKGRREGRAAGEGRLAADEQRRPAGRERGQSREHRDMSSSSSSRRRRKDVREHESRWWNRTCFCRVHTSLWMPALFDF